MTEEPQIYVGCFTFERSEAEEDGELEGEADGELEGEADGELEGEADGELEGEADGELEGEADGELEGELYSEDSEAETPEPQGAFEADDFDEGTFEIIVEAAHRDDALARCRAKLTEIVLGPESLGPIVVYLDDLIEISRDAISRGVLFSHQSTDSAGNRAIDALPAQQAEGTCAYSPQDFPELCGQPGEGVLEGTTVLPPFWDGRKLWQSAWKLYWCTTDDHDEDWFVVARSGSEATLFFEAYEGYEENYADAELVCLLPRSQQERTEAGWPDSKLLEACGAEIMTSTPQDGGNKLRQEMGTGSQLVRIKGRVFAEGDIVGNTLRRFGDTGDS